MKRLLIPILLLSLFLFGCSNQIVNNPVVENTEEDLIVLSDEDVKVINDILEKLTVATAYENANFKIEMNEKDPNSLKISVIKPILDLMKYFNVTTADGTVKALNKSLVFNTVYDNVKSSIDKDFTGMKLYYYDNEENYNKDEFYSLKMIPNK